MDGAVSFIRRWFLKPISEDEKGLFDADFNHVDSQSGFKRIFILHLNITQWVVRGNISAGELGTMSKNSWRGNCLWYRAYMGD